MHRAHGKTYSGEYESQYSIHLHPKASIVDTAVPPPFTTLCWHLFNSLIDRPKHPHRVDKKVVWPGSLGVLSSASSSAFSAWYSGHSRNLRNTLSPEIMSSRREWYASPSFLDALYICFLPVLGGGRGSRCGELLGRTSPAPKVMKPYPMKAVLMKAVAWHSESSESSSGRRYCRRLLTQLHTRIS